MADNKKELTRSVPAIMADQKQMTEKEGYSPAHQQEKKEIVKFIKNNPKHGWSTELNCWINTEHFPDYKIIE